MIKSKDFESALNELETVVTTLDGELQLENALQLFERGMQLSKQCEHFLNGAKQKVEVLKRSSDGVITIEPFDADEEVQNHAPAVCTDAQDRVPRVSDAGAARTSSTGASKLISDTQLNLNLESKRDH